MLKSLKFFKFTSSKCVFIILSLLVNAHLKLIIPALDIIKIIKFASNNITHKKIRAQKPSLIDCTL